MERVSAAAPTSSPVDTLTIEERKEINLAKNRE
jgi:hypothetical protein